MEEQEMRILTSTEVFQQHKPGLSNEALLAKLDEERRKFSKSDEDLVKAMIDELIVRNVYPKETIEGNPNTVYQMVAGWGAYWFQWREKFRCRRCGADLRNQVTGPPFLIGDPNAYSCPVCRGDIISVPPEEE